MKQRQKLAYDMIISCKNEGIMNKTEIARRLNINNPEHFPNTESARKCVRVILGCRGFMASKEFDEVNRIYMDGIPTVDIGIYDQAKNRQTIKAKHYIITSAQNNTPVFKPFWENIKAYAKSLNSEIYVIALRYRNPTSVFTDKQVDVWADEVIPYLDANRHDIHKNISIMSDVKMQPTAENPLSGMEGMSGAKSCIFGHARVHMQFVPVLKDSDPKIMMTTGSVTRPDYTDSKAGKKGEFHHTYGFSIVSIVDKETAIMRYVTAHSDGSFIDCDIQVSGGVVSKAPRPLAIILGDIHAAKLTESSISRIKNTLTKLRPPVVVMHDVLDGASINPHESSDPIKLHMKMEAGINSVQGEVDHAIRFIKSIEMLTKQVVIVNSNHDRFLDRFIANSDWKKDLVNAKAYAKLMLLALSGQADKGLFAKIVEVECPDVKCLAVDESFVIADVELGNHGDIGANGSKGSPMQFRRLSTKLVTGHTHSPLRGDGHLVVGCQDLNHGYNVGLSSWGLADVIINADGKRQHLIYSDGKFKI